MIGRRSVLQGAGALFLVALVPNVGLPAFEPLLRDEWVYDPPLGIWRNAGASQRILRAAQRRAGVRVVQRPYPEKGWTRDTMTDFGRCRVKGACREWGMAWRGKLEDPHIEEWMTRSMAITLDKAGPVWFEPPHLRAVFRDIDHPAVAYYGVSA